MIDSFRDTGKPLLSVLAAKQSIFLLGLAQFKRRCAYANIVNDRAAVFYTTGISKTDPFVQLNNIAINYVPGYSPVVIDPDNPVCPKDDPTDTALWVKLWQSIMSCVSQLPFFLVLCLFVPAATLVYLIKAAIQTAKSRRRIRLHEEGKLGVPLSAYKVPLIVEEMRNVVEEMYESVNAARVPEYLLEDGSNEVVKSEVGRLSDGPPHTALNNSYECSFEPKGVAATTPPTSFAPSHKSGEESHPQFPLLALTPAQFTIIDNLNSVGFRKYPVYIHMSRHSHAAIIVRMPKKSFKEGKTVIRHWLEEEFSL
ncbi:hypothetical protein VTO42DRAFT_7744 [Malbranchea cinnamomea]